MSTRAGRGRWAGGADTRGEILDAARASFAEAGYAGTSIRKVAAAAGVDPALVHHYFGTKDDLFIAALEMPTDPRRIMAAVAEGDRETVGARLVEAFLDLWDDPDARRPIGLLSHQSLLYVELSLLENLTLAARLYDVPEPESRTCWFSKRCRRWRRRSRY